MSETTYVAAAVQFEPVLFDKQRNITRLVELVEEAAVGGAKLITTPEMGISGYCFFGTAEAETMAEPVPGPSTEIFAELAAIHDCHIVIGMPERDLETGLLYNSAVLIGPQGIIGTHRKTHGYIAEPKWAAPGDLGHQVFDTPLGRIALLICMDIHFVETARVVALGGADVICHISNWLAERTPAPYWISRAFENSCYLIESNRWGLERGVQFSGGSCIIAPDSGVLASCDSGDGVVTAEINLAAVQAARATGASGLSGRRPQLYRDLHINSYLWNPRDFFTLYGNAPMPPGRASVLAVAQHDSTSDATANIAQIRATFVEAVGDGADLVVFPELSVSGPPSASADYAESIDTEGILQPLLDAAAGCNGYLVVGMAERGAAGMSPYNSAVLIGPEGIVAVHRKIHLSDDDDMYFAAGDSWTHADIRVGRVALLHGDDVLRPESGRVAALRGCDVIAVPARIAATLHHGHPGTTVPLNYPIPRAASHLHWHHMRVRAGENNVYLAYANPPEFGGRSGVFGPDTFEFPRRERVAGPAAEVLLAPIDTSDGPGPYPANVVRRKDLVSMRLPHHYRALSAPDRPTTADAATDAALASIR
ncbi:nitrilase-related carbon-nitrogen hydrolase [Mycolicibacterium baixiangningiae]|uniref:nitrilase-related carbon-nitrogen hydrolase n=1 Tax=Mycolicibacterium baixiangningiae TaxID=2761578 RepID=UPI0018663992|nr:nitrilase-related carbon-nitrogen hydrolase [Mycolicibacterium baixiangningiae]